MKTKNISAVLAATLILLNVAPSSAIVCEGLFVSTKTSVFGENLQTSEKVLQALLAKSYGVRDGSNLLRTEIAAAMGDNVHAKVAVREVLAPTLLALAGMASSNNFSGYQPPGKPLYQMKPLNEFGQAVEYIANGQEISSQRRWTTMAELQRATMSVHQTAEVKALKERYEAARTLYDTQMQIPQNRPNSNSLYRAVDAAGRAYSDRVGELQRNARGDFDQAYRGASRANGASITQRDIELGFQVSIPGPVSRALVPVVSNNVDYQPYVYNLVMKQIKSSDPATRTAFTNTLANVTRNPRKFLAVFAVENQLFRDTPSSKTLEGIVTKVVDELSPNEREVLQSLVQLYNVSIANGDFRYHTTANRADVMTSIMNYLQEAYRGSKTTNRTPAVLTYQGTSEFGLTGTGLDLIRERTAWALEHRSHP